ncbi:MAG: hypothetical protein Q8927_17155 [Bacteroidota bacterium]|nr:hypothetical protein [Bacteroidota bacterium]MDP4256367.1 hypothetical protein [Bacteroidota bacterium]
MAELTPTQKLDVALSILAEKNPSFYKEFSAIAMQMEGISLVDTQLVLEKLIKDGFAEQQPNRLETDPLKRKFCITFEGKLHLQRNGYEGESNRESAENIRVSAVEAFQQAQAARLSLLTAWIAGGTIALATIELWKMALEYHWFSFCH